MDNTYYNTTHETGSALATSKRKANSQNARIVELFTKWPNEHLSPSQVHSRLFSGTNTPLTSVRRSMTNLAAQGIIEKTSVMVKGLYGKLVHTYRLKVQEPQLHMFI